MIIAIPRDTVNLVNTINPEGECPVCRLDFEQNERGVVHHEKENPAHNAHLIHRACLKQWCETRNQPELIESNCMTCAVPMNVRPIFQLTRMQKLLRDSPKILAKVLLATCFNTSIHTGLTLAFRRFYPYNLSANQLIAAGQIVSRVIMGGFAGPIIILYITKIGLNNPAFRDRVISFLHSLSDAGADEDNNNHNTLSLSFGVITGLYLSAINSVLLPSTSATRAIANTGILTAVCTGAAAVLLSLQTP